MLRTIDISNWQKSLDLRKVNCDAVICKATEGLTFVDAYCDKFVQQAIAMGKPWGFYHFARNHEPEAEAQFFWENCKNYFYSGVPVLDIEDERIKDWGAYAQRFVDKLHAITGVYPIIYCSASQCMRFAGYPLVETCGLWVAGYPTSHDIAIDDDAPKFAYDIAPWKFAALWQYTSRGIVKGYDGYVDLSIAYMDSDAWKLYANPSDVSDAVVDETVSWPKSGTEWHLQGDGMSATIRID